MIPRLVRFELWDLTFQAGLLHHKVLAVLMMNGANAGIMNGTNAGMLSLSAIVKNQLTPDCTGACQVLYAHM